jgi:hypothetical protein
METKKEIVTATIESQLKPDNPKKEQLRKMGERTDLTPLSPRRKRIAEML